MSKEKVDESIKKEKSIITLVRKHLRKHFKRNTPRAYQFHQYVYFKEVVKIAKKIAFENSLDDEQTEILLLTNWFRFAGITEKYKNYEQISAKMAEDFLTAKNYPRWSRFVCIIKTKKKNSSLSIVSPMVEVCLRNKKI